MILQEMENCSLSLRKARFFSHTEQTVHILFSRIKPYMDNVFNVFKHCICQFYKEKENISFKNT